MKETENTTQIQELLTAFKLIDFLIANCSIDNCKKCVYIKKQGSYCKGLNNIPNCRAGMLEYIRKEKE